MWDWLKTRASTANPEAIVVQSRGSDQDGSRMAGKYAALYKYLEHRYSNTVFLTFGQIEDLLGFPLPDLARSDREWWTVAPSTKETQHSQAWTQANMTAIPNLLARNVLFERAL